MINDKLFKTFKILLGKGRAFNLTEKNIGNISKSFLKPFDELIRTFYRIALTIFPSQNNYTNNNQNNSEKLNDITNLEKQFDITSSTNATLNERAKNLEAQFGLVGGQSYKYLEQAVRNTGIDAKVIENVPVNNLLSQNIIDYGNSENSKYGSSMADYGKSGYIVVANGNLKLRDDMTDPIIIDDDSYLFLIESSKGGTLIITTGQFNMLVDLILKIKPLEKVALLNINIR